MFKTLQVLRTAEQIRNTKGHPLKAGSRVVVVNVKDGVVKARYGTNKTDYRYINAPVTAFVQSVRGRPVGTGKNADATNVTKVKAASKAKAKAETDTNSGGF